MILFPLLVIPEWEVKEGKSGSFVLTANNLVTVQINVKMKKSKLFRKFINSVILKVIALLTMVRFWILEPSTREQRAKENPMKWIQV